MGWQKSLRQTVHHPAPGFCPEAERCSSVIHKHLFASPNNSYRTFGDGGRFGLLIHGNSRKRVCTRKTVLSVKGRFAAHASSALFTDAGNAPFLRPPHPLPDATACVFSTDIHGRRRGGYADSLADRRLLDRKVSAKRGAVGLSSCHIGKRYAPLTSLPTSQGCQKVEQARKGADGIELYCYQVKDFLCCANHACHGSEARRASLVIKGQ